MVETTCSAMASADVARRPFWRLAPERFGPLWLRHQALWDTGTALLEPPVEPLVPLPVPAPRGGVEHQQPAAGPEQPARRSRGRSPATD